MKKEIVGHIDINAPASKVWRITALEFDRIGEWASSIPQSHPANFVDRPVDAPVAGRVCSNTVPGFAAVTERFTYYDAANMRYGYEAIDGLPKFMQRAANNWSIYSTSDSSCRVEFRGEIELALFPGAIVAPFLMWQMKRLVDQVAEELKHYVEKNQPHPRKQAQLAKAAIAHA